VHIITVIMKGQRKKGKDEGVKEEEEEEHREEDEEEEEKHGELEDEVTG